MMDRPKVTVVIINWNGLADTSECLESVRTIMYPNYQTIVIDNGSPADDAHVLGERFGDSMHLIASEKNLGFAGGCNIGIRYALGRGADYVLLLNNDTVVDPAFLSGLVQAAEEIPDGAAFCPKICYYDRPRVIHSTGGRVNAWMGRAWQVGRDRPDEEPYGRVEERDYADGACMLMRRSALDRVGLLDEEYFAYWEETDWCARAGEMGLKSYYVPNARIWHKAARSQAPDSEYHYLFRRNAFLFLRKRKSPLHLFSAVALYLFVFGPFYLIRHPSAVRRLPGEARAVLWHLTRLFRSRGVATRRT